MFMTILGEKVFLRKLNIIEDNFDDYLGWLRDTQNNNFIETARTNYTMSELVAYVDQKNNAEDVLFLGIFLIESNRLVGTIKLEPIDKDSQHAWLGILIGDPEDHRKGYGSEAIMLLLNHARNDLQLKQIFLGVNSSNLPAINLYKKIGFQFAKFKLNVMFLDINK